MENSVTKTAKKRNVRAEKPKSVRRVIDENAIRQRAFEIYLEDGDESNDIENWLQAERELKGSFEY